MIRVRVSDGDETSRIYMYFIFLDFNSNRP